MSATSPIALGGLWQELRRDRLGLIAAGFLALLVLAALLGPMLLSRTPGAVDLSGRLLPPS